MKLPMSSRLLTCCSLVHPGDRVADIGCDHGYLGIYLLTNGIASSTIEADINPQPLESARRNGRKFGVDGAMTFCLSDGLQALPRDFDCLVCAGMGADTIISILGGAPWLREGGFRLILQCQSKRPELRRWLYENGYHICRETLAQDGKFIYTVMEVCFGPEPMPTDAQLHLSPQLLADNHPLLPAFYDRVVGGIRTSVAGLRRSKNDQLPVFEKILADLEKLEGSIHGNG